MRNFCKLHKEIIKQLQSSCSCLKSIKFNMRKNTRISESFSNCLSVLGYGLHQNTFKSDNAKLKKQASLSSAANNFEMLQATLG